jgi:PKD repeat protein
MTDANGCTTTACDSVFVDADGNVLDSEPCAACVEIVPALDGPTGGAIPWTAQANNCSTGSAGIYTYTTSWGDGTTDASSTHTYDAPGVYNVCLTMLGNNGCTSMACDSVHIDTDGVVEPSNCQAGFWVVQAYVQDSLDPSVGQPIPNELWLYNLSSGGTGNYQFFWDFGDGTSSTDPYPSHFYSNGGPYVLCLTLTDDGGCSDTVCDSVSVDEDGLYNGMIAQPNYARSGFTLSVMNQAPTAIPEAAALRNTRVWPNPVDDQLNLGFTTALQGNMDVDIIDLNGRSVSRTNIRTSAGNNRAVVNVQDLPAGMYMLRIGNMETNTSIRFVKK